LRGGTSEFSSLLFVIFKMYYYVIQTLWWSLLSDKQIWLPIRLLERPLLGLVAAFSRHNHYVLLFYLIMKWYKFLFLKKIKKY
jgi:hypothetical protein